MKKLSEYSLIKNDIKTGDRLEWRTNSFIGWAIRKVTKDYVNHTSMVIRFRGFETDKIDNRFTLEALNHGIELNRISRRLQNFDGEVFWYPLKSEFENYRSTIGSIALDRVGIAYDYNSLFKQLFGRVFADARKLFCSEYVFLNCKDAKLPTDILISPRPGKEMQATGWWEDGVKIL